MESQTKIKYTDQKQSKEHIFQALQSSASIQNQLIKKKNPTKSQTQFLFVHIFFVCFFECQLLGDVIWQMIKRP